MDRHETDGSSHDIVANENPKVLTNGARRILNIAMMNLRTLPASVVDPFSLLPPLTSDLASSRCNNFGFCFCCLNSCRFCVDMYPANNKVPCGFKVHPPDVAVSGACRYGCRLIVLIWNASAMVLTLLLLCQQQQHMTRATAIVKTILNNAADMFQVNLFPATRDKRQTKEDLC